MHQIRFQLGLCPRPRWGSLQCSPSPLAGFKGAYFWGKDGRGREGRRMKGPKGRGRKGGKEGKEREVEGST